MCVCVCVWGGGGVTIKPSTASFLQYRWDSRWELSASVKNSYATRYRASTRQPFLALFDFRKTDTPKRSRFRSSEASVRPVVMAAITSEATKLATSKAIYRNEQFPSASQVTSAPVVSVRYAVVWRGTQSIMQDGEHLLRKPDRIPWPFGHLSLYSRPSVRFPLARALCIVTVAEWKAIWPCTGWRLLVVRICPTGAGRLSNKCFHHSDVVAPWCSLPMLNVFYFRAG